MRSSTLQAPHWATSFVLLLVASAPILLRADVGVSAQTSDVSFVPSSEASLQTYAEATTLQMALVDLWKDFLHQLRSHHWQSENAVVVMIVGTVMLFCSDLAFKWTVIGGLGVFFIYTAHREVAAHLSDLNEDLQKIAVCEITCVLVFVVYKTYEGVKTLLGVASGIGFMHGALALYRYFDPQEADMLSWSSTPSMATTFLCLLTVFVALGLMMFSGRCLKPLLKMLMPAMGASLVSSSTGFLVFFVVDLYGRKVLAQRGVHVPGTVPAWLDFWLALWPENPCAGIFCETPAMNPVKFGVTWNLDRGLGWLLCLISFAIGVWSHRDREAPFWRQVRGIQKAGRGTVARKLVVFDFDRTIAKEHVWGTFRDDPLEQIPIVDETFADLDAFRAFVKAAQRHHQIAVATFGRRDVVDKALTHAFGRRHGFIISTPADHGYPEGSGNLGDKNTQLATLSERVRIRPSEIVFFDDDERNVREATKMQVKAFWTPSGITKDIFVQASKYLTEKQSLESLKHPRG